MDPTVLAEIDALRQMKPTLCAFDTVNCLEKTRDLRTGSFCFAELPGVCKRTSKETSRNVHAGERWRSPTTRTCASARLKGSSLRVLPATPEDPLIGREQDAIGGFPALARCSPVSLKTAASWSKFSKTASNINRSSIAH